MDDGYKIASESAARSAAAAEKGTRNLTDNYVVLGPVAETEFSSCVIIRETETGNYLLAKYLKDASPAVQERFHAAILQHGQLEHENIVQTVDWRINETGNPVFITEFLEGINLEQLIDEVGTLEDDEEITTFLTQVLAGLEYAHKRGIVHGGLKPANILITQPEDVILVKLGDFGAINTSRESPENPERNVTAYSSPEQRRGEVTETSDVFAVAAIAYQLITGYLPFIKIEDGQVVEESDSALAPISDYRPDIPEAQMLGGVLERALALDPAKRTQTIAQFKQGVCDWYQTITDAEEAYETAEEALEEADEEDTELALETAPSAMEQVTEIGIIRKTPAPAVKNPDDNDEFGDIDELDELDELDKLEADTGDEEFSRQAEPKTSGFGSDIADAEFDIDGVSVDQDSQDIHMEQAAAQPPDQAVSEPFAAHSGATSETPDMVPDATESDMSGRFSRVARLPALQAIPGMEASTAAPPKKEVQQLSEHDKEREQIKKFKKHKQSKRRKSKLNSTMTKLMALRTNQVEQSFTVSTKISETFAQDGAKESPQKVILRLVATIIIFGASVVLVLANLDVLKSVWLVASRSVSAMLGKKHVEEPPVVITTVVTESAQESDKKTTPGGTSNTSAATSPKASMPVNQRYRTNLMPVHHPIDRRNVMPRGAVQEPGTRKYAGTVYPYLFTEEEVDRDPKKPRPTDSEIKEIPGN